MGEGRRVAFRSGADTVRCSIAAIALIAGCGRLGFDRATAIDGDAPITGEDAALDDALAADAPPPSWPMPLRVIELSIAGVANQDPTVTDDRLEMIFSSGRTPACSGGTDFWVATRPTTSDPWSTPTCLTTVSSNRYEAGPEISGNGLTLYFSSARLPTLGGRDIYRSTRPDRLSAWSAPVRVDVISTAASEDNIALSYDGQTMVIDSDQGGDRDLYVSTLSGGMWITPVRIDAVATLDSEGAPALDSTGSRLYFTRGIEADQTSFDIFVSERIGGVFGPAVVVPQVNSTVQDGDPFITPDGHMFMSSTRSGDVDIYQADPSM